MTAKRMKWSPLRAVALAGLTLAAVIACDVEAPTAIDDALDVLANPEAAANADGSGASISDLVRANLADGSRPLVFVDHVEVTGSGDDIYSSLNSRDPRDIARVEIIKGAAAADLVGDRGAGGVIYIFSRGYWEEIDPEGSGPTAEPEKPSTSDAPPPGDAGEVTPAPVASGG